MSLPGISIADARDVMKEHEEKVSFQRFNRIFNDPKEDTLTFVDTNSNAEVVTTTANAPVLNYVGQIGGIPKGYLPKLEPGMRHEVIRYHLDRIPLENVNSNGRVILAKEAGDVRPTSAISALVRPSDVLDLYVKMFGGDEAELAVNNMDMKDGSSFSILSEKWNYNFMHGDASFFGVRLDWPGTLYSPSVYASSHRPICGNLMNGIQNIGRINTNFKVLSRPEVLNRFRAAANRSRGYIDTVLVPQLAASTNVTFENFGSFLKNFAEQHKLGPEMITALTEAWMAEQGNTMYHVVQACTRAATYNLADDADACKHFYVLADAILANIEVPYCAHCHRPMEAHKKRKSFEISDN